MKNGRPPASNSFENRFQILVYATNNKSFKTADIALAVLDVGYQTIRIYLNELIQLGYIEKITTRDYQATSFAKQMFNVDVTMGDV